MNAVWKRLPLIGNDPPVVEAVVTTSEAELTVKPTLLAPAVSAVMLTPTQIARELLAVTVNRPPELLNENILLDTELISASLVAPSYRYTLLTSPSDAIPVRVSLTVFTLTSELVPFAKFNLRTGVAFCITPVVSSISRVPAAGLSEARETVTTPVTTTAPPPEHDCPAVGEKPEVEVQPAGSPPEEGAPARAARVKGPTTPSATNP